MRRFRFDLEGIRTLREHREREQRFRLAGITAECNRLEQEAERLEQERRSVGATRMETIGDLRARETYLGRLSERIADLRRRRRELEPKRREAQEAFLEARKERSALESVRETRERAHYKEERRREGHELDDIAVTRAGRRRTGGEYIGDV